MKLQFTNGYRPHFDQITRIMQFALSYEDQTRIPREEFIKALGMSERQVKHLTGISIGFGLFNSRILTLTNLGKLIAEKDSFFDRIDTLWLIHYIVSSNPQWVVWYRIINHALVDLDQITINWIVERYFSDLKDKFSKKTLQEKLPTEIGAVLWSYANSELSRLHLLHQEDIGIYQRGTPGDIQPLAFLGCILVYRERYAEKATALPIKEICYAENSPGLVLNLPEPIVRTLMGQLHDTTLVRLEKFGDLDQVRFSDDLTKEKVLSRIYAS